ncbi:MAG: ABC transporter permease [Thaumarchaeota archaeon]|nr:ABC transporter permease [Nitrososphaerota archaeon]
MRLRYYIPVRVSVAVIELIGVTAIAFFLSRLSGNPLTLYIEATTPVSSYPLIIAQHHLNDPLYIQYFYYLSELFRGDLGLSRVTSLPVSQTISGLFPWTLELAVAAAFLTFAIGVPLGIIAGWKKESKLGAGINIFASFDTSVPQLIVGLVLIMALFYYPISHGLPYLPSSGGITSQVARLHPLHTITGIPLLDSLLTGNFAYFANSFSHLIMPAITLSLFPMGYLINTVRSSTVTILNEDFVTFLQSTGASWWTILFRHVLRNNLVYLVTIAGLLISSLIGGTVVVETIFGWPGLGLWAANSILSFDIAGVLGFTIVVALIFIVSNLVVDLLYPVIDPRIKL